MKNVLLVALATAFIANLPMALAEPQIISKIGSEQTYVKRIKPATEGMSPENIDTAKRFGTYKDLKSGGSPELSSVWVGTVVSKENGQCTETTTVYDKTTAPVGEPKLIIDHKLVNCTA